MIFQMRYACFLSLLIASFCNRADCAGNEERCMTSEGQTGTCIALPRCDYAMNIVKQNGIGSAQAQNFLRPNQCGFEDRVPKVCCPPKKNSVDSRNTVEGQTNSTTQNPSSTSQTITNKPIQINPLSLLPRDCGLDESDRIIGGEMTVLGEFPWMAVLEYRDDKKMQTMLACGGTLITKRYVLTAAHCIRAAPSYMHLINVRLGEYDVLSNPDCIDDGVGHITCADQMLSVPIERQIVHESYNSPEVFRNDIALLRLAHDVKFTRFVKPICLPAKAGTSSVYWSAGWGAIEIKQSSDTKLKVSLPSVDSRQCAATYRTKKVILGPNQICAGGKAGKDTCKGDSGGPLMKQVPAISGPNRWVIDGVLSIGHSPCGLAGWPGVYTKVYDYVGWILNNLKP